MRIASSRPFQMLFSWYLCNQAESYGECTWKLRYIIHLSCRFCGHLQETILHMPDDFVWTHSYRLVHIIKINTLAQESESSLLKIAKFDVWIWRTVPFNSIPLDYHFQSTLISLEWEKKWKMTHSKCNKICRQTNRICLVIQDRSLNDTNNHSKI